MDSDFDWLDAKQLADYDGNLCDCICREHCDDSMVALQNPRQLFHLERCGKTKFPKSIFARFVSFAQKPIWLDFPFAWNRDVFHTGTRHIDRFNWDYFTRYSMETQVRALFYFYTKNIINCECHSPKAKSRSARTVTTHKTTFISSLLSALLISLCSPPLFLQFFKHRMSKFCQMVNRCFFYLLHFIFDIFRKFDILFHAGKVYRNIHRSAQNCRFQHQRTNSCI